MSEQNLITVFTRWKSRLLRQAMRMLPSEEDAEDVLQDAFIKLWAKACQLESDEEAIALTTVTIRNLSIDRLRHNRHLQTESLNEQPGEAYDHEENSYEVDDRKVLVEQIMKRALTPIQQQIVQLREYEQKSYEEVAKLLGMKEPAVRMQLSRARKAIRDEYKRLDK
jgi:RNA polymerase sigma-70 factor (ECF subfamily)